jgi:hypothetical protein
VRTDGSSLMIELLVVSAPNACLFYKFMISWVLCYSAFVWSFITAHSSGLSFGLAAHLSGLSNTNLFERPDELLFARMSAIRPSFVR